MGEPTRVSLLESHYQQYLVDQDSAALIRKVSGRYTMGTLESLVQRGSRHTRRAAALMLGLVGQYQCNMALGRALQDDDRGVRSLAENSLRAIWCRDGDPSHQQLLAAVIRLNTSQRYDEAAQSATELIEQAPWFAEAWNQRAVAYYGSNRFSQSIRDCHQALEINPYHFGAAAGMGQCYLQLGNYLLALESFRRALRLNPGLEGVRANVAYLERKTRQ